MSALGPAGPGRTLAFAYAVFALAAGARSAWQIATRSSDAPLPFALSAVAAALYLVLALTINSPRRERIAVAALALELTGVVVVGALSVAQPSVFPDETVWSGFGSGYLLLPIALPLLGIAVIARRRARGSATREQRASGTNARS